VDSVVFLGALQRLHNLAQLNNRRGEQLGAVCERNICRGPKVWGRRQLCSLARLGGSLDNWRASEAAHELAVLLSGWWAFRGARYWHLGLACRHALSAQCSLCTTYSLYCAK